jgi:hypothetical protein
MNQDFILYERQPDGTYKRTGELPKKTRNATVVSSKPSDAPPVVKTVKYWDELLARGPLSEPWYKIVPAESKHPMSAEAKEKLAAFNAQRLADREPVSVEVEGEDIV